MSLNLRWWSFVALCAYPICALAAATVSPLPNVTIATRGQSVVIYGSGFPDASAVKAFIRTGKEAKGDKGTSLDVKITNSQTTASAPPPTSRRAARKRRPDCNAGTGRAS